MIQNIQIRHTLSETEHAKLRKRQRGINDSAVDHVMTYGSVYHAGKGDLAYWLSRKDIKLSGISDQLFRYINIAVIISPGGTIRTVMRRHSPANHWNQAA